MKSTQKNKIVYGKVDLPDDEFDPKNGKFRITMWLDLDLLDEVRKKAQTDGMKYQPWINKLLRAVVLGEEKKNVLVDEDYILTESKIGREVLSAVMKEIDELHKRMDAVESKKIQKRA